MGKQAFGSEPKVSSAVVAKFGAPAQGASPMGQVMAAKAAPPATKKAIPAPPKGPRTR